jgi:hypothetical protein
VVDEGDLSPISVGLAGRDDTAFSDGAAVVSHQRCKWIRT